MMIPITVTPKIKRRVKLPPDGYSVFRALAWGTQPLASEANCSLSKLGVDSNFGYIPVWDGSDWSATKKYSRYLRDRGDMDALNKLQPKRDYQSLRDCFSNIYNANSLYGTTWWWDAYKYPLGTPHQWDTTPAYFAGTQLWTDQLFAATIETYDLVLHLPGFPSGEKKIISCRKILPFKREDFSQTYDSCPWKINKYTVVYKGDIVSDVFRGMERYIPMQVLDTYDFPYVGGRHPDFYIPMQWCTAIL